MKRALADSCSQIRYPFRRRARSESVARLILSVDFHGAACSSASTHNVARFAEAGATSVPTMLDESNSDRIAAAGMLMVIGWLDAPG
jgi:hypothetical protein